MANPFDQFDKPASAPAARGNPFDQFDSAPVSGVSAIPGQSVEDDAAMARENARLRAQGPDKPATFMDKAIGAGEAGLSVISGLTTGLAGMALGGLAGAAGNLTNGRFGNPAGVESGMEAGAKGATYAPRTKKGQEYAQAVGEAVHDSGVQGLPIGPELAAIGRGASQAGRAIGDSAAASSAIMAGQDAAQTVGAKSLRELVNSRRQANMSGVGAAATSDALARAERAQSLPVPIDLTLGQKTRDFNQMRFEKETAKLPKEGTRLRDRFAEQNDKVFQNFDAFIDETGAQAPNLRSTGQVVNSALIKKYKAKKEQIKEAYKVARESGDMSELVDVTPIRNYLEENRSAATNAPILNSVESELSRLTGGGQYISINDIEELRKMTGKLGKPNMANSNAAFAPDVVGVIDSLTAGKGGPAYQQARRMYENFSNEFKNAGVINKLMRTKPGTRDRAIAFEDVFDKTIMSGSLDDVRAVRRTLQTGGEEGKQAWRELQGQTLNQIKEKAFGNSARDELGNPVGSPAKLDQIIKGLDADGKLDFIFGKRGAERIRDVNDLAKDIYTAPPGAVNTSNTASVLIGLMDTAVSGISGIPLPIGTGLNYAKTRIKQRITDRRVTDALQLPAIPARQQKLQGIGGATTVDDAIKAAGQ